jgi:hypothetical protein
MDVLTLILLVITALLIWGGAQWTRSRAARARRREDMLRLLA